MKHTTKALRTAYSQFIDLRIAVKQRALSYFITKGFVVQSDQIETFLDSWHFRSVFRSLVEASLDDMFGSGNWRIVKRGTGNRVFIEQLRVAGSGHATGLKTWFSKV